MDTDDPIRCAECEHAALSHGDRNCERCVCRHSLDDVLDAFMTSARHAARERWLALRISKRVS